MTRRRPRDDLSVIAEISVPGLCYILTLRVLLSQVFVKDWLGSRPENVIKNSLPIRILVLCYIVICIVVVQFGLYPLFRPSSGCCPRIETNFLKLSLNHTCVVNEVVKPVHF